MWDRLPDELVSRVIAVASLEALCTIVVLDRRTSLILGQILGQLRWSFPSWSPPHKAVLFTKTDWVPVMSGCYTIGRSLGKNTEAVAARWAFLEHELGPEGRNSIERCSRKMLMGVDDAAHLGDSDASLLDGLALRHMRALAERFDRRPGEYRWEHKRRCRQWDAWIMHVMAEQRTRATSETDEADATDPAVRAKHAAAAAVLWTLVCVFSGEPLPLPEAPEELRLPRIAVADRADDQLDTSGIVLRLYDLDVEMETLLHGDEESPQKYYDMAECAWSMLRERRVHDLSREDFAPYFERWLLLRYDAPEPLPVHA